MLKKLHLFIPLALILTAAHPIVNTPVEIKADIAGDESWRIFPTYAALSSTGQAKAKLRAWVYEEEPNSTLRKTATRLLRNLLGFSDLILDETIFTVRARYFLVDNERNKSVSVFFKKKELARGMTDESGHTQLNISWNIEEFAKIKTPMWLNTKRSPHTADETASDRAIIQLIPDQGLSVISDIDDTIKKTGVLHRSELIERTFGKPFEEINGMPGLYQNLARGKAASFHYVSSSPWQLLPELEIFLTEKEFPLGSFHLKSFRLKDSRVFALFADPTTYKTEVIEGILKDLPHRNFYLIGDSGEKDPEIYADIAQRFPGRISQIFIRLVPTHSANDARFKKIFSAIPRTTWQIFTSANEIKL